MPFSLRKLTKLQIVAVCLIVVSALTVLGINRKLSITKATTAKPVTVAPSAAVAAKTIKASSLGKGYIQRGGIWPQLRSALDAYGNRLEKPGKERVIAVATLGNTNIAANEKNIVRLIFEFPDKLRLEKQKNGKIETTVFDGKTKVKLNDVIKKEEEDELETLVFDSVDHFMAGHMQGQSLRFLGDRFRLDDGTAEKYNGSYYDIYQMMEPTTDVNNPKGQVQPKRYFFNSDTHRLERITYQVSDKKGTLDVLVEIGGWQKIDGQEFPKIITRSENGKPTLTLNIDSFIFSTRADDGIFATTVK